MASELERVVELEQENNKMLKKLVGDLRWRRFWGILKWTVIIALTLGAYYYVQPYLDALLNMYTGGAYGAIGETGKLIDLNKIQELAKSLRN